MIKNWSSWKRFPDGKSGGLIEAPIGPGVYEVRRADSGELVAFGHSSNVATSISDLKVEDRRGGWTSMFRRQPMVASTDNLEYRTYAAATRSEAKTAANRFIGLRQTFWRHRSAGDWVGGRRA